MKRIIITFLLSILLCLLAVVSAQDDEFVGGIVGSGTESLGGNIGMANPAAEYCTNQGYEYSDGKCVFPDGSSCDAWKFYRGECKYEPKPKPAPEPAPEPIVGPGTETSDDGGLVIGMANPAAVYCTNQGYEYSDGKCVFPDGSSCDAWKFYRGECSYNPEPEKPIGMPNPASVYCKAQGYDLEIRTDPKTGGEVGYCVFPDGSSCEEWAFYRGECKYEPKPKPTPTPTPVPPAPKPQAPMATYTCDAPPVGQEGVIQEYDAKLAPPSQVYFQGNFVSWRNFEGNFPATSPALWIKGSSGWSWNAVCPLGAWISEVMYLPRNGSVSLYLMDPSGNARRRELGSAFEGYKQIILNANAPGLQMAIFTLDGVPSNVIFIDVKSDWTPCGTRDVSTSASQGENLIP